MHVNQGKTVHISSMFYFQKNILTLNPLPFSLFEAQERVVGLKRLSMSIRTESYCLKTKYQDVSKIEVLKPLLRLVILIPCFCKTPQNTSRKNTLVCPWFAQTFWFKCQLISKADFKVFIWTKKWTKIFLYFCPSSLKWVKSKKKNANYYIR